uniref:Uncharacterized protein n=1 Tax=Ditylenchus dipsaci TaxID=166011 RepID=A0A915DP32_9BILA
MHLEAVLLIKTLLANTKSPLMACTLALKTAKASLLYLFDELISSSQVPIFAADNLHVLPWLCWNRKTLVPIGCCFKKYAN